MELYALLFKVLNGQINKFIKFSYQNILLLKDIYEGIIINI